MENWEQYRPKSFEYNGRWIKNWFSNMEISPFNMDNVSYLSVENRYQACKATTADEHLVIASVSPSESKKMGRRIKIRSDWESVKYSVMKSALRTKFSITEWKNKLLATGDEVLIEWNNWGDRIWGVDINDNKGQNLLGKALMEIREELKQ